MPLLLVLVIVLAFPFAELYVLVQLATAYGWWLALYLLCAAITGWALIRKQKLTIFGRMLQIVQTDQHPVLTVLASARLVLVGALLIFPGLISDVIAVLLLLIPIPSTTIPAATRRTAANDEVIEGEWRRED